MFCQFIVHVGGLLGTPTVIMKKASDKMEMNLYSNPSYDTVSSSHHAIESSPEKKSKNLCCIKCLIAGWIVNFALIIAVAAGLTFFLTRTALNPEEKAQNQDLQSSENQSVPICPPGPPGPSGPPGIAGKSEISKNLSVCQLI